MDRESCSKSLVHRLSLTKTVLHQRSFILHLYCICNRYKKKGNVRNFVFNFFFFFFNFTKILFTVCFGLFSSLFFYLLIQIAVCVIIFVDLFFFTDIIFFILKGWNWRRNVRCTSSLSLCVGPGWERYVHKLRKTESRLKCKWKNPMEKCSCNMVRSCMCRNSCQFIIIGAISAKLIQPRFFLCVCGVTLCLCLLHVAW